MGSQPGGLIRLIGEALRDLAPIILVVAFFQIFVIQQPFPDLEKVLGGLVMVVLGLAGNIRGRNLMTDGFGLIAFASLTPIAFVLYFSAC